MDIVANLTNGYGTIGYEGARYMKTFTEPLTTDAPALTSARPVRRDRAWTLGGLRPRPMAAMATAASAEPTVIDVIALAFTPILRLPMATADYWTIRLQTAVVLQMILRQMGR